MADFPSLILGGQLLSCASGEDEANGNIILLALPYVGTKCPALNETPSISLGALIFLLVLDIQAGKI